MGEQHFTQLRVYYFTTGYPAKANIFQRKTLQLPGPIFFSQQPHQGRTGRDHLQPRLRCHAMAIAGGAGGGIGKPAGCQNDGPAGQRFAAFQRNALHRAVRNHQLLHPAMQQYFHACCPQPFFQRSGHIAGLIRNRECPAAPLDLGFAAQALEQRQQVIRRQAIQRAVKKPGISGHVFEKLIPVALIGHVAAALAGDIDFLAQLFVPLQQAHPRPGPGGKQRSHHSGCAAADYDQVIFPC